ncbi:MAG: hypothetical protein ACK5LK_04700 [Chthoniobacterales bacterium]
MNPLLANWAESLRNAAQKNDLAAIKLFPNYHGYSLKIEALKELREIAKELKLPVLVQIRINDERNQPVSMQVPNVPVADVLALSRLFPDVRFITLCAFISELAILADGGKNLFSDISFCDGEDTLRNVSQVFPLSHLVFGSHEAFTHVEASILKLAHASISDSEKEAVASTNLS